MNGHRPKIHSSGEVLEPSNLPTSLRSREGKPPEAPPSKVKSSRLTVVVPSPLSQTKKGKHKQRRKLVRSIYNNKTTSSASEVAIPQPGLVIYIFCSFIVYLFESWIMSQIHKVLQNVFSKLLIRQDPSSYPYIYKHNSLRAIQKKYNRGSF